MPRRADPWQAGLREDARDGAVVHLQLAGDSADAPVFGVEVAQDLRFQFRGNGQVGFLFGQVGQRMEPGSCPESPA